VRKSVTLGIAGIICSMALLCTDRTASAQAGATGGTIGKTDKSVSGDNDSGPHQAPRQPRAYKPDGQSTSSSCRKVVGNWSWKGGTADAVFNSDGTGRLTWPFGAASCTWKCDGSGVIANWSIGVVDRITISGDGNSLLINNSQGETFSSTRK
jgi:hypothetical protein